MGAYQINDLENLTGIKAHTIRIWEKRYGLITPARTATNRRFYDDAQVRKLLNVTTLLAYGHKISTIASYSEEELFSHINKENQVDNNDSLRTSYVNDLIKTMISFDEAGFEKIFSASVLRYGLHETMLKIIYPFLRKTGVLWSVNKAAPVEEHFATAIIKKKLMAAIDGLLPVQNSENRFVLFLPHNEWHEIGLLVAHYLLRYNNIPTIYLGQNVPDADIEKILEKLNPRYIMLFFVTSKTADGIGNYLKFISEKCKNASILVSGYMDLLNEVKQIPQNVEILPDVKHLERIIAQIKVASAMS